MATYSIDSPLLIYYLNFKSSRQAAQAIGNPGVWEVPKGKKAPARYGSADYASLQTARIEKCYYNKEHQQPPEGVHPAYMDMAVCKLKDRIEFDPEEAWPICLPRADD